jgi:hypothetical protein
MPNCEEWKVIPGFGGRYEVSSLGRVRTYSNGRHGNRAEAVVMAQKKTPGGYPQVHLYKPHGGGKQYTVMIHRLVAELFVSNPDGKTVVNHKDGNKANNTADNLEWVTASENSLHAVGSGLMKPSQRQKEVTSARCSIPVVMFNRDMVELARFRSAKQASVKTGADISAIIKCCRGKLKSTKGYKWKYAAACGIGSTGRV